MPTSPPSIHASAEVPARGLLAGLARLHQTVLLTDESGSVLWMSDALRSLCGRRRSAIGRSARDLFGSPERHDALRARVAAEGLLTNERIGLVSDDGSEVSVEVSAARVSSRCGGEMFLAVVRPLAESDPLQRDRAHTTTEYFRAILDGSAEAVLAVDRRGFVTYANPALERLLEQRADQLIDKPVALVLGSRGELEGVANALGAQGGAAAEFQLSQGDGARLVLAVCASPIRLPDGTHAGTVAFLRDITEQRRSEEQLESKNQELEHYVHAVSHDLRTPLVSLLGFSRLLAQDYGDVLTDTGRHFLNRIEQASRTMESLINDLLELSRIGQANGQRDWVDPLPVLKQLTNELKPRLDSASVSLDLPESPPLLLCVRTQLYQVFSNLIGNALDHMGDRGDARIEVCIREEPDAHVVCVRDNGIGIAPEHHERVFETFQTLGRRTGGRKGTGVGLSIVKKIAEAHRGRVWVESDLGRGAAFLISFPRT